MQESDELAFWQGVTVAAWALLAASIAAGIAAYVRLQHHPRNMGMRLKQADESQKDAWVVDAERYTEKAHLPEKSGTVVVEALRILLEEEVTRCLVKESCAEDQLHKLNRKIGLNGHSGGEVAIDETILAGALLPGVPPTVKPDKATDSEMSPVPVSFPLTMPPLPLAERFDVGTMTESPAAPPNKSKRRFGARNGLDTRAGAKHGQLPRVQEAAMAPWRKKLHTMQQELYEKDTRTQQLHRQLRNCQQALWRQTIEGRTAKRQIQDLLCDSQFSPQASMSDALMPELRELRRSIADLSSRLADARSAEMQWSLIAKRQQTFYAHNGQASLEGVSLLKKHPAGEIFLALPTHEEVHRQSHLQHGHDTWEQIKEDDDDDALVDAVFTHANHAGEPPPWDSTDEDHRSPNDGFGLPDLEAEGTQSHFRLPDAPNDTSAILADGEEGQGDGSGIVAPQPSGTARSL